jgi:hypothetical protein
MYVPQDGDVRYLIDGKELSAWQQVNEELSRQADTVHEEYLEHTRFIRETKGTTSASSPSLIVMPQEADDLQRHMFGANDSNERHLVALGNMMLHLRKYPQHKPFRWNAGKQEWEPVSS